MFRTVAGILASLALFWAQAGLAQQSDATPAADESEVSTRGGVCSIWGFVVGATGRGMGNIEVRASGGYLGSNVVRKVSHPDGAFLLNVPGQHRGYRIAVVVPDGHAVTYSNPRLSSQARAYPDHIQAGCWTFLGDIKLTQMRQSRVLPSGIAARVRPQTTNTVWGASNLVRRRGAASPGVSSDDESAIRARTAAWAAADVARDVHASLEFLADDALILAEGMPPVRGKEGAERVLAGRFDAPYADIVAEPRIVSIAASGDLAYDVGNWTQVLESENGTTTIPGKSTIVWRKHSDGWKAEVVSYSTDGIAELDAN